MVTPTGEVHDDVQLISVLGLVSTTCVTPPSNVVVVTVHGNAYDNKITPLPPEPPPLFPPELL